MRNIVSYVIRKQMGGVVFGTFYYQEKFTYNKWSFIY